MLFYHPALFARIILVVLCAGFLCGPWVGLCAELQQTGVVQVQHLNMRSAANPEAPVVGVLEKGTEVRILNETGKWLQVLHAGKIGYLYNNGRFLERYVRHKVTGGRDRERELAIARAREIERRIREKEKEIRQVAKRKDAVLGDLDEIDRRLSQKRRQIRQIMEAAEQTSARIAQLEKEAEEIRTRTEKRKQYAGRRLIALYKICRLGEMNLLATADSAHQLFSRKAAIEQVLAHDESVITDMVEHIRRLNHVISRMHEQQKKKQRLAEQYENSLADLAAQRKRREALLSSLKTDKTNTEMTLAHLRKAGRRLSETISGLKQEPEATAGDFAKHRGLLKMPVKGKIVSTFGKHENPGSGVVRYRNGIEIRAERGEPVRAVFDGKIVFADWVKGYGRVMIVSHGGSYYSVYARIQDLFNRKGDTVESGQVIATVGDTGSISGPALYFEIRRHGDPVDPMPWLDHG